MVEGFYTAKFKTHDSVQGAGVVLMHGGKLIGGDNAYKYVGKYAEKEGKILVDVIATRFAPGISVFGDLDKLELTFVANIQPNGVNFNGTLVDSPGHKLEVVMERQAESI
jgi:T3SS negative regulator,GrlR